MGMPSNVGTRWKGLICCCWASRCDGAPVDADVLIRLDVGGEL